MPKILLLVAGALVLSGCQATPRDVEISPEAAAAVSASDDRIDDIQRRLDAWSGADTLAALQENAEGVRNLVTGPGVPGFGDSNSDGTIEEDPTEGILPGADGTASVADSLMECAGGDLFGGSWRDPAQRWQTFFDVYDRWSATNNTFPTLPSHAQRVVGWASLALKTDDLVEARSYAGHAQLHVTAIRDAVADCSS